MHTPGPWLVEPHSKCFFVVTEPNEEGLRTIIAETYDVPAEEEGNALLMATAPDMLGFLRAFVDGSMFQTPEQASDLMARARKVALELIIKAEGRS